MSEIEIIIQKHTDYILSGNIHPPDILCPKCHEKPETFKLHECSRRSFRYIEECLAHIVYTFLARWKCVICRKTFTEYPSFALPYKRFNRLDIERLSREYVEKERQTYRQTVSDGEATIGYKEDQQPYCDHFISHTTPWFWLGQFGTMENTTSAVLHLISQKNPQTCIFREISPIAVRKYRSSHRKSILETAQKLLRACLEFENLFGHPFFPRFETSDP